MAHPLHLGLFPLSSHESSSLPLSTPSLAQAPGPAPGPHLVPSPALPLRPPHVCSGCGECGKHNSGRSGAVLLSTFPTGCPMPFSVSRSLPSMAHLCLPSRHLLPPPSQRWGAHRAVPPGLPVPSVGCAAPSPRHPPCPRGAPHTDLQPPLTSCLP